MHASSSCSSSSNKSKQSNDEGGSYGSKCEIFDELLDDPAFEKDDLACFRGLVLDLSYRPVNVADVLEYYDQTVNSPSGSFYIPAVLGYCSSSEYLTIDHIVPIASGGEWKWENLVTACAKCNSRKGHKTPEEANMKLMKVPKAPKDFDILAIPLTSSAIKILRTRKGTPKEWRQYLSVPSSAP
ncbi:hypothetical protein ACH5RR_003279 [Cinchona calisaya]|uniref:HNH nuclease domain-containing protein n=1 Tax=Cinchona calisaya TaxID=153742 RepID=A0ABD3AUD5_9GENT